MKIEFISLLILIIGCTSSGKIVRTTANHPPDASGKLISMPSKENFYIFILAGQSNMAGRGIVEPQDTVTSPYVLALNGDNEWVYASEPLHYYEPARGGLDCGLSFGKKLSALYGRNITIGLAPCAVGGSSIEQWLGDSTHRDVNLYSNLLQKAAVASKHGTNKGVLWHQGENNATATGHKDFYQNVRRFFERVRNDLTDPELSIYSGELGSYLKASDYPSKDSVNRDLHNLAGKMENLYVIGTHDFTALKDTVYFDSKSQRLMGVRFAEAVYKSKK
jgi:hypothetical protein